MLHVIKMIATIDILSKEKEFNYMCRGLSPQLPGR